MAFNSPIDTDYLVQGQVERDCSGCGETLERKDYSRNQWLKGEGISRCKFCISENIAVDAEEIDTARDNHARSADFDFTKIIGTGAFRNVAKGVYTKGQRNSHFQRTGQPCVGKWFKSKSGVQREQIFFEKDITAVDKAVEIITEWNREYFIESMIRINRPQVWTNPDGRPLLVEPYIEDFVKFNSNSGWINPGRSDWIQVMQALSHYSFHATRGRYLLCDLQGGFYRDGVVLSDPVVHCSGQNEFGLTDLGAKGISSFFSRHRCGKFCSASWHRPLDTSAYFQLTQSTTMVLPS